MTDIIFLTKHKSVYISLFCPRHLNIKKKYGQAVKRKSNVKDLHPTLLGSENFCHHHQKYGLVPTFYYNMFW